MVEKVETLLLLLGMVSVLAVVAERFKLPFPILLVLAGLGIGLTPGLPHVRLNPDVVLVVFLPPLLFSAAWNFPWYDFRSNLTPIFAMAVGLVFATMLCVAYACYWLIPGMTLATGFVLGAIVSPPDAVAAGAVLHKLNVPRRLLSILEGESLVNDSSGLVAYQFAVAAVITGSFSLAKAGGEFVWMSVGGILLGWGVGAVVAWMHRFLREAAVELTLTILTPYIAYLLAEKFGFSGVLAVVTAGLYIGHRSWEALSLESRLQRDAIWKFIDYLLNGLIFVLIGLQFPAILQEIGSIPMSQLLLYGLLISGVVIAVRFLWIFLLSGLGLLVSYQPAQKKGLLNIGGMTIASWAGMRGVVSLAAALALPANPDFPQRHLILFLTFCVIFTTLVLPGLSLPWLVRKLKVEEEDGDYGSEIEARVTLMENILREIDTLVAKAPNDHERESLASWRVYYSDRLAHTRQRISVSREISEQTVAHELAAFPIIMNHVRSQLAEMRRDGRVNEETRRRIQYDFDMEEQRVERLLRHYQ